MWILLYSPFPQWSQSVGRMTLLGNNYNDSWGYCFLRKIICYLILWAALYGNIMALCNSEVKNKDAPIKWNHHGPLNWMSWHTKSFTAITRCSYSSNNCHLGAISNPHDKNVRTLKLLEKNNHECITSINNHLRS